MSILVTGGAGYIGSHTVVELQNAGYEVVVVDNLVNSSREALKRVEKITGKPVTFYEADINDKEALEKIFAQEKIESCIHFAGLKAVGESVAKPLEYYMNNISGSLVLFDVMRNHGVKKYHFLIFSNCIRRSGICTDYRRMPEGTDYQSIRSDKGHVRADFNGYPEGRPGMECHFTALFQPDWCA